MQEPGGAAAPVVGSVRGDLVVEAVLDGGYLVVRRPGMVPYVLSVLEWQQTPVMRPGADIMGLRADDLLVAAARVLGCCDAPYAVDERAAVRHRILAELQGRPPLDDMRTTAAAVARRLCQMFDAGGESMRSVRARHAEVLFALLHRPGAGQLAEFDACDADPVGYLEDCERVAAGSHPAISSLHAEMLCGRD